MRKKLKIAAIIPARASSKRIPKKNIKPLAGKPLIGWTIETALKSKIFDRVIVSTEDKKIAQIARKFGAEIPFQRPKKLARANVAGWQVLQHVVRELAKRENYLPDIIVYLSPAAPFRQVQDIKRGLRKLIETRANLMLSVCEAERNPYFNMVELKKGRVSLVKKASEEITQSQRAPKVYGLNDSIYIIRREALLKNNSLLADKKTSIFLMPKQRGLDIDDEFDFEIAEYLMKKTRQKRLWKNLNY